MSGADEIERAAAAIQARLRRIEATRDLGPALEPAARAEARRLGRLLGRTPQLGGPDAHRALGWLHWYRYGALPAGKDREDLETALAVFGYCFANGIEPVPEELLPLLAEGTLPMAAELLEAAQRDENAAAVDSCVRLIRRVLDVYGEENRERHPALTLLCVALQYRFESGGGGPADLDEAIESGRAAVRLLPSGDLRLAMYLANLGAGLRLRFDLRGASGELTDLNESIDAFHRALTVLPAGARERSGMLSNLGTALRTRFGRTGNESDLRKAAAVSRAAVAEVLEGDPGLPRFLSNLAYVLAETALLTGDRAVSDEAIDSARAALAAAAPEDPLRFGLASNLAAALWLRFERDAASADLDEAIARLQYAVAGRPKQPELRALLLSNLGVALLGRYDVTGSLADLDGAVNVQRDAVAALPPNHVRRPRHLANLSAALRSRHGRTAAVADVDEAVAVSRQAVALAGRGHPERARYLANLGTALDYRYRVTGAAGDVEDAVWALREAADSALDHPDARRILSNLGNVLQTLHAHTDAPSVLDDAIDTLRRAASGLPTEHPYRTAINANLGNALRTRFRRDGAERDRHDAAEAFATAAQTASGQASVRIQAAAAAAVLIADHAVDRAARLLETAVLLLPETTARELARADQQYHLGGFAGLAGMAAAAALDGPRPGETAAARAARALGLLEAGRAVLLSQALATRNDLTELRAVHPRLAERYEHLRDQLDRAPDDAPTFDTPAFDPSPAAEALQHAARLERTAGDRRRLAAEFERTTAQIRRLRSFERFQLPPTLAELLPLADYGDIVVFNVSERRSDALLVTRAGISVLPLPGLGIDALRTRTAAFEAALDGGASDADADADADAEQTLTEVLRWLWDVAAGPVLHALGRDDAPAPDGPWPRLWWVPGGLLGQLPLHAAGHHGDTPPGQPPRTVIDRVVSSYVPTLRALSHARRSAERSGAAADGASLIVAMPQTPDGDHAVSDLESVAEEAEVVSRLLPSATVLMAPPWPAGLGRAVVAAAPTSRAVLSRLPGCAFVHFACHGVTDPGDPSRSGLLLQDHVEARLTVARLAPVRLTAARLAYLSACSTARSDSSELIDEAIHLTSAFQLAGFPHVVGTLWPIDDEIALTVAADFYTRLRATGLDAAKTAETLHHISRQLRDDEIATPSLWAAHLHAGA
jgi:tetratricopeptide (TPR) repeat protein